MRFEESQKVKQLIGTSAILSPMEKAEWLQLLPNMNDKQAAELMAILTPKSLPKAQIFTTPMPLKVTKPPLPKFPDINQKEITEHITTYPESKITPEDLQKKVESAADNLTQHISSRSHIEIPKETFKESIYVPTDVLNALRVNQVPKFDEQKPKAILGSLISEEDFQSITAQMLHDSPKPAIFFEQVLNSLSSVTPRSLLYAMVEAFEKSPLYRVYVDFGIKLLDNPAENREQVYDNTLRVAQERGEDYLTRAEFEAMTDFRTEMDKYFI